ncbi:MAG: potassium-transporting ATPase subunit C [Gordonia sp. (in: high G+C Gram-positive bacteria)]|uniref:potassium-transporting ATPase subunit C n=1 Tax=Gordonia sp. (in: high G+C Gram-positive bacteria) TaxID=84139 RepID=UPI0039E4BA60
MRRLSSGMWRQCVTGLVVLAAATVVLGVVYPAVVWGLSRVTTTSAEGSVIHDVNGCAAGSSAIGVDVRPPAGAPDPYLHGRVTGGLDDPLAPGDPSVSAASDLGPNSTLLRDVVTARRAAVAAREGVDPAAVPADAITGSASGLDPHISPRYAALQAPRLARTNGLSESRVREIIAAHTSGRRFGVLGAPRVDVLAVNLALGHRVPGCRRGSTTTPGR